MKEVIYLMQERVRDNDWETLHYTTAMDWQRAIEWSKVCPESLNIAGLNVQRRLIAVTTKEWVV